MARTFVRLTGMLVWPYELAPQAATFRTESSAFELEAEPSELLTVTEYKPACAGWRLTSTNGLVVAPGISEPLNCHWKLKGP